MARLSIQKKTDVTTRGIPYTLVELTGLITTDTSPNVDEILFELAQQPGTKVVLDFAKVGYVNSTGLGQMIAHLDALIQTEGDLVIMNAIPEIKRVIKLLGIDKVLKVVLDKEAAEEYLDTGNIELFEKAFQEVTGASPLRKDRNRPEPTKTRFPRRPEEARVLYASSANDVFADILELRWGNGSDNFRQATSYGEINYAISAHKPDLLIVDHQFKNAGKICEDLKKVKENSLISVIRLYANGQGADQIQGFYVRENEFVAEPFEINELIALAEAELSRAADERQTFVHQIHLQIQNFEGDLDKGIDFLAQLIRQSGVDERIAGELRTGVREAVDNAYRHGNKSQPKRKIYINYVLDQEKIVLTVEDEGEGFDSDYYLALGREEDATARARKQQESGKTGGLGIMLMMKCLDDLEYNSTGNIVKLTKRF